MNGFRNPKNPEFRPLSVRVSHITENNKREIQLKFKCFLRDYDRPNRKHIELGEFDTTYEELREGLPNVCIKQVSL